MENEALRLVVIPELGGKIVSLKSRRTGREWLWLNPHIPLGKPPRDATNFGLYDSGGWDEIFPTVNPCRVPESAWGVRELTDHGELWYRPWDVVDVAIVNDKIATIKLVTRDLDLHFEFERTLTLPAGDAVLHVDYKLINYSDRPMPFIWALHPLIAIKSGNEIVLPLGTEVSTTGCIGLEAGCQRPKFKWPYLKLDSGESIDLRYVPDDRANIAIKLFAEYMNPQVIRIVDASIDEALEISFADPILHCGLWLNYGAWSGAGTEGYFNVGVEPTTLPYDNLANAYKSGLTSTLTPLSCQTWKLNLSIR